MSEYKIYEFAPIKIGDHFELHGKFYISRDFSYETGWSHGIGQKYLCKLPNGLVIENSSTKYDGKFVGYYNSREEAQLALDQWNLLHSFSAQ